MQARYLDYFGTKIELASEVLWALSPYLVCYTMAFQRQIQFLTQWCTTEYNEHWLEQQSSLLQCITVKILQSCNIYHSEDDVSLTFTYFWVLSSLLPGAATVRSRLDARQCRWLLTGTGGTGLLPEPELSCSSRSSPLKLHHIYKSTDRR